VTVLGTAAITRFSKKHANSRKPLARFLELAKTAQWTNFVEIKETFPATDYASDTLIFDIGGNKYRLIARINFESQELLIDEVLTHEEYDRKEL
jgi:mRNA interferase HigB